MATPRTGTNTGDLIYVGHWWGNPSPMSNSDSPLKTQCPSLLWPIQEKGTSNSEEAGLQTQQDWAHLYSGRLQQDAQVHERQGSGSRQVLPPLTKKLSAADTTYKGKICSLQWSLPGSVNHSQGSPMPSSRWPIQYKFNGVFIDSNCFGQFFLSYWSFACIFQFPFL